MAAVLRGSNIEAAAGLAGGFTAGVRMSGGKEGGGGGKGREGKL